MATAVDIFAALDRAVFKATPRSVTPRGLEMKLKRLFNQAVAEAEKELRRRSGAQAGADAFMAFMKEFEDELAKGVAESIGLTRVEPGSLLANNLFQASQATLIRLTGDVRSTLEEIYRQGLNERDAVALLREKVRDAKDYELKRIARTEVHSAQETSNFVERGKAGVAYHKWITAQDNRVRPTKPTDKADHRRLHGIIVRVGDPFPNGQLYPGDRVNGKIEDWINCRCAAVSFIMPSGKSPPPGSDWFYESDLIDIASAAPVKPKIPPLENPGKTTGGKGKPPVQELDARKLQAEKVVGKMSKVAGGFKRVEAIAEVRRTVEQFSAAVMDIVNQATLTEVAIGRKLGRSTLGSFRPGTRDIRITYKEKFSRLPSRPEMVVIFQNTIAHEMGHSIDQALGLSKIWGARVHKLIPGDPLKGVTLPMNSYERERFGQVLQEAYAKQVDDIIDKIGRAKYLELNQTYGKHWYFHLPEDELMPVVSRYSLDDEAELFSECLAAISSGQGAHLKKLHPELYDLIIKHIYGGVVP